MQAALARAVHDRRRVDRQLQPAHQAGAAHLFDHGVLQRQRAQLALEVRAGVADVLEQPVVHQLLEEERAARHASRLPP